MAGVKGLQQEQPGIQAATDTRPDDQTATIALQAGLQRITAGPPEVGAIGGPVKPSQVLYTHQSPMRIAWPQALASTLICSIARRSR